MTRGSLVGTVVAGLLMLVSHAARADGCNRDWGFGNAEAFMTFQNVQNLAVNGSTTPGRLVGLPAPSGGQLMAGAGLALQLRCDYFVIDMLSVRMASGLGAGLGGSTTADGGPVNIGLGPVSTVEVGLPFLLPNGFQLFPSYNWKVAFKIEWGIEHQWADATLTGATLRGVAGDVDDWDFYFRSQLSGCRRLSRTGSASTRWGCLAVAPLIYEKSWFPGVSIGARVDL